MRKPISLAIIAVMPIIMVGAFLTSHRSATAPITARSDRPAQAGGVAPVTVDDEGDDPVDLFGNEVSDAVARYTFDAGGSQYELHSPQTELPRLGSPKS